MMETKKYIAKLYDDFPFFMTELWKAIGLPEPAWHQLDMADYLQHGPNRRIIIAFRGASKTWITIAYALWRLFRNKKEGVMVISKTEKHSRDSLRMARNWISKVPFLQHMEPQRKVPRWESHKVRDSVGQFDVRGAPGIRMPSFAAYGNTGQVTGNRATVIIADDVETLQNTMTADMRQRLRSDVTEFDNIIIPGGTITFLGSYHHEESLYLQLQKDGYDMRVWPERFPEPGERIPFISKTYAKRIESGLAKPGQPTWPERFGDTELQAREASQGRSRYLMQMRCIPWLGDTLAYPLKLEDFIVFPFLPDKAPVAIAWGKRDFRGMSTRVEDIPSLGFGSDAYYHPIMVSEDWTDITDTVMWIDPSGRGEDKTAYAIASHANGIIWVHDVGGLAGGYDESTLEMLAKVAIQYKVRRLYIEDNFGQGMLRPLLEPVFARVAATAKDTVIPTIETVRVAAQKEVRIIETLEPPMNSHRIVLHPRAAANTDLQRQITRITRMRNCLDHDDMVDALAGAVSRFDMDLAIDPTKAAERLREQKKMEAIEEHLRLCGISQQRKWFKIW